MAPSHGPAPVMPLSATVIFWRCFTLAMGMHIAHATGSQCTSHYNTKPAVLQIGLSPRCSVLCPDPSRKLFQSKEISVVFYLAFCKSAFCKQNGNRTGTRNGRVCRNVVLVSCCVSSCSVVVFSLGSPYQQQG